VKCEFFQVCRTESHDKKYKQLNQNEVIKSVEMSDEL